MTTFLVPLQSEGFGFISSLMDNINKSQQILLPGVDITEKIKK